MFLTDKKFFGKPLIGERYDDWFTVTVKILVVFVLWHLFCPEKMSEQEFAKIVFTWIGTYVSLALAGIAWAMHRVLFRPEMITVIAKDGTHLHWDKNSKDYVNGEENKSS